MDRRNVNVAQRMLLQMRIPMWEQMRMIIWNKSFRNEALSAQTKCKKNHSRVHGGRIKITAKSVAIAIDAGKVVENAVAGSGEPEGGR
jgi:hypothetical protein